MSPSLLRCSSFCRPLELPTCEVAIDVLQKRKRRRADDEVTAYANPKLLISLGVRILDVVLLDGWLPLLIQVEDSCKEDTILLPPTLATYGLSRCSVQAYTCEIPVALEISIRPTGQPTRSHILGDGKDPSETYPAIPKARRLLCNSSFICVPSDNIDVFFYEVECLPFQVCWTSHQTQFHLVPHHSSLPPLRRLPCILSLSSFFSMSSDFSSVSHPSTKSLQRSFMLSPTSRASDKIIHLIGTSDNHAHRAVQEASYSTGMRYLSITGLAAFAFRCGKQVSNGSIVDKLAGCKLAFEKAKACAPCVLHISHFHRELAWSDEPLRHSQEMRFLNLILSQLEIESSTSEKYKYPIHTPPVIVVLSTAKPLLPGPLQQNLVQPPVIVKEPNTCYARYLWGDQETFSEAEPFLDRMTARQIQTLKRRWDRCENSERNKLLAEYSKNNRKSSASSIIPSISWEDVGGLSHVRQEIMDAVQIPLKYSGLFHGKGRSGILLYGPPGTGKTLAAKAVANECQLPFISIKGPELLGSYVGESEANVRKIFDEARKCSQKSNGSILFFDELDSLAPRRGGVGDGGGVMDRVVATLLSEMDKPSRVFLIGATNRPDLLDPSLLRPGRLDRLIFLGLTSDRLERAKILAASIRKYRLNDDKSPMEVSLDVVDQLPPNLSGADLSSIANYGLINSVGRLCRKAQQQITEKKSLDDVLDQWDDSDIIPVVSEQDLVEAGKQVIPSVEHVDLQRYSHFQTSK